MENNANDDGNDDVDNDHIHDDDDDNYSCPLWVNTNCNNRKV